MFIFLLYVYSSRMFFDFRITIRILPSLTPFIPRPVIIIDMIFPPPYLLRPNDQMVIVYRFHNDI